MMCNVLCNVGYGTVARECLVVPTLGQNYPCHLHGGNLMPRLCDIRRMDADEIRELLAVTTVETKNNATLLQAAQNRLSHIEHWLRGRGASEELIAEYNEKFRSSLVWNEEHQKKVDDHMNWLVSEMYAPPDAKAE